MSKRKGQSKKARNVAALSGGALVAAAPFVTSGAADAVAQTYTVSNLNDSGAGSFRQAVADANGNSGADTITFDTGGTGTITLTTGPIEISDSVTITGPGAPSLTIDGNGDRIFYIYSGAGTIDVTISGTTLTGADSTLYGGAITLWGEHLTLDSVVISDCATTSAGGAILAADNSRAVVNDLQLVIRNSTISGNTAEDGGGGVAVVYTADSVNPALVIANSTITGNDSSYMGGGLWLFSTGSPASITNSTISGNTADNLGAGIAFTYSTGGSLSIANSTISGNTSLYGGGGLGIGLGYGAVTVSSSTISGNSAPNSAGVLVGYSAPLTVAHSTITANTATGEPSFAGGIRSINVAVTLDHSVVSGNVADISPDIATDSIVASFTGSFSMVGDLDGEVLGGTNNLPEGDAKLGPLTDNGGPTLTHLPLEGSPLLDAGDPAYADPQITEDQRGLPRIAYGRIDVGAVEVLALPPTGGSNGVLTGLGAALLAIGGALHLTGRRSRRA